MKKAEIENPGMIYTLSYEDAKKVRFLKNLITICTAYIHQQHNTLKDHNKCSLFQAPNIQHRNTKR